MRQIFAILATLVATNFAYAYDTQIKTPRIDKMDTESDVDDNSGGKEKVPVECEKGESPSVKNYLDAAKTIVASSTKPSSHRELLRSLTAVSVTSTSPKEITDEYKISIEKAYEVLGFLREARKANLTADKVAGYNLAVFPYDPCRQWLYQYIQPDIDGPRLEFKFVPKLKEHLQLYK